MNSAFLAIFVIGALFESSLAQRDYIVGDALGWVIPPGSSVYTTWAANKTFRVGDTLVFNFPTGAHDVSKVTRANYDSCNARNSILMLSNSPANVTLNETGSHYFICGFPGHCGAGQKLAITVGSTSSPAPQPSTATPQPSSVPTPLPSAPAPAPQVGSTPTPSPSSSSPSPSTATPPSSSSPSPSIATPPSSTGSPPSPTNPSTPSPAGDNNNATPPSPGNSATSLSVAGLSATFLSLIVAFFM